MLRIRKKYYFSFISLYIFLVSTFRMEVYQPLLTGHHVTHQTPIKHQRIQSHQFLDRHQKTLSKIKLRLGYLSGIFC